jgi:uncharacterized protein
MRIGVISDTHGLLRPQALHALAGADRLVHAGDIGAPEVLQRLAELAPLVAVRGNNDRGPWARHLPDTATIECGSTVIHLLHDVHTLALDPPAAGVRVIVAGHSHRPRIEWREDVLYVNPGSAGPRRFRLPVSIAWLNVGEGEPDARIVELEV